MTEDPQLVDYLLLLRFGTSDAGQAPRPVLNFTSILKVVRKPVSTIRDLIKSGIESKIKKLPLQRHNFSKIDLRHVDYLCSQIMLREWAHLSLIKRYSCYTTRDRAQDLGLLALADLQEVWCQVQIHPPRQ